MEYSGGSFLQILNDDSQIPYENSTPISQNSSLTWDNDDDSFEVGEVTNVVSSDLSLADALRSIDSGIELPKVQSPSVSLTSERTFITRQTSLKEELKAKIQTRRKSQGVGELRIKFEPPKSYSLTPEEERKVEKRKLRNRQSANKSRQRRKEREDVLQKEVDEWQAKNDELSKEITFLNKVKHLFHLKLANHQCTENTVMTSQVNNDTCTSGNMTSPTTTNAFTRGRLTSPPIEKMELRNIGGRNGSRTILKTPKSCHEPLTVG